eukprot:comp24099_c0_seq1/m.43471 comp24099_c0_seq1/g.43471  ORF comp24099_c0_seq1/g.43471 comp24099_c0_seq1/m.43471 type:complete len:1525 (-) comp24099_c0_seq1:514-5088(-)
MQKDNNCDHDHATCSNTEGSFKCTCREGYAGDGVTCADINECARSPVPCAPTDSKCTDTDGSYTCICNTGYEGDASLSCTDINECTEYPPRCSNHATCANSNGSFSCTCDVGYTGSGVTCSSICDVADPCKNSTCILSPGVGVQCTCANGFSVDTDNYCIDNDECKGGPCSANSTCENLFGSFSCGCVAGYRLASARVCANINECAEGVGGRPACASTATCTDTDGSFGCTCNSGYTGNGTTCNDINECTNVPFPCNDLATCTNTPGAYSCTCQPGYTGNGVSTCTDINECSSNITLPCSVNATCTNNNGSFTCTCMDKYVGDGITCEPAWVYNKCLLEPPPCGENTICVNRVGGYTCDCLEGYTGNGTVGCTDINECSITPRPCHDNATCTNRVPGYQCTCNVGYSGNGVTCQDINECDEGKTCANGNCVNSAGSFTCACNKGYTNDIGTGLCQDINECQSISQPCDPTTTTCTNTIGGFTCDCRSGHARDTGLACKDINECEISPSVCGDPAVFTCTNRIGDHVCGCAEGYGGTFPNCVDIDECLDPNTCGSRANCNNTVGAYACTCKAGFAQNWPACDNINECVSIGCGSDATCSDSIGSFTCTCNTGYSGVPRECQDVNECAALNTTNQCPAFSTCSNTIGSFACVCNPGFQKGLDDVVCDDVNECADHPCHTDALCTNTQGAYQCTCKDGYSGNGVECTDINECDRATRPCDLDATCTNQNGSFSCTCKTGHVGNGEVCTNINECNYPVSVCPANSDCRDTHGSFACDCNEGYTANGTSCMDIDECAVHPIVTCQANAYCHNLIGSHECLCNLGYTMGPNGVCNDIYECEQPNQCDAPLKAICTNLPGSYSCRCSSGYQGNGTNCIDVDECDLNPCFSKATCRNLPGTYTCTCNAGWTGNGVTCSDINECSGTNPCVAPAQCLNNAGSFECHCGAGYHHDTPYTCADTNECADATVCMSNATCTNQDGSFTCTCVEGYVNDGPNKCIEDPELKINHCDSSPCDVHATCVGIPRGFTCTCDGGYSGDGKEGNCTNINECAAPKSPCGELKKCIDTAGSFLCQCPDFSFVSPCPNVDVCDKSLEPTAAFDTQSAQSCGTITMTIEVKPEIPVKSLSCRIGTDSLDLIGWQATGAGIAILMDSGKVFSQPTTHAAYDPYTANVVARFTNETVSIDATLRLQYVIPSNLNLAADIDITGKVTCEWVTGLHAESCNWTQVLTPIRATVSASSIPSISPKIAFGPATPYSLFTSGNVNSSVTTISGLLAIGGSLSTESLTVGAELEPQTCDSGSGGVVIVANEATWDVGQLKTGSVVVGNLDGSKIGADVTAGSCGVKHIPTGSQSFPLDFKTATEILRETSKFLSSLASTGKTFSADGALVLVPSLQSNTEVFAVTGADLLAAGAIYLSEPVGAGTTVIINIAGQSDIGIKCAAMEALVPLASRVIWNFFETKSFEILGQCDVIPGTILGPDARMENTAGQIRGHVYVNEYSGSSEIVSPPLEASFPCPPRADCCAHARAQGYS